MITANFQSKALAHDIRPDFLDETMTGALLENAERNVNPDRRFTEPTAEELDIARSLNGLDIQLYGKARSRFERIYLSRSAPGSFHSPAGALGGSV